MKFLIKINNKKCIAIEEEKEKNTYRVVFDQIHTTTVSFGRFICMLICHKLRVPLVSLFITFIEQLTTVNIKMMSLPVSLPSLNKFYYVTPWANT